jgi:hypothetical protein
MHDKISLGISLDPVYSNRKAKVFFSNFDLIFPVRGGG